LYYVTGDLEKARAVVEQGLTNPKADFYLAYLDAIILYRLSPQLKTEAAAAAERAIQANTRFAPAYFQRGKIRMEQNDSSGALAATGFPDGTRLRHRRSREMASEVRRCQREGRTGRCQRLGRRDQQEIYS